MKKRNKVLAFLTAFTFLTAGISAFNAYLPPVFTDFNVQAEQSETDFPCEIHKTYSGYSVYGSKEYVLYTAEEAVVKGVPEGYEGDVLQVIPNDGTTSCGVVLDFTAQKVPFSLVQALEFRVYLGVYTGNSGKYPQIRIPRPFVNNAWVYQRDDASTPAGEWTTLRIDSSNTHTDSFHCLQDEEGYLSKFELCLRTNGAIDFYIDKISYVLAENDGVAPVITFDGGEEITTSVGANVQFNATAYDAQEKRDIEVQKSWSDGALDADGLLVEGVHTLTLTATDFFGNTTEKQVQVTVEAQDEEAPVIHIPDIIYAEIGSAFLPNVSITDNCTITETTFVWSEGAFDEDGKLVEGTHYLTVTAVDDAGNRTEKTVTVCVTEDGYGNGDIIDEEELSKEQNSDSSGTDSDSGISSDTGTDSDSDTTNDTATDTGTDSDSDTTNDTATDTGTDSDSDTTNDTATDDSSGSNSVSDTDSASGSDTASDAPSSEKKSGCGSAIAFGTIGGVALLGAAFVMKKKKED